MWLSQVETVSSWYLGRIITALVLADMVSLHWTTRLIDDGSVPGRVRTITARRPQHRGIWAVTQRYLGRTHSTLPWTTRLNDDVAVPGRGGINTALGPHLRGTWAVTS